MSAPPIPAEQAALLAAIVADPDNDTPRLAYADWLDENGDEEQAAFIRESIAFARSGDHKEGKPPHPGWERGREWLTQLGLAHAEDHGYDRGFPKIVVYGSTNDFLDEAEALFDRIPVHDLAIWWQYHGGLFEDALAAIADLPQLARLHTLRLANYDSEVPLAGWRALIHSPYLRSLRMLSAGACGFTDGHAEVLAECTNLHGLTALDLSQNKIGVEGMLAIVRSPHLAGVTRLGLGANTRLHRMEHDTPELYSQLVAALTERFGSDAPLRDIIE
jgi:uncharacterized protein (TIGR02996 family)